jgi:hypothetical protein
MGQRGPQPKEKSGATVAAHCPPETIEQLAELVRTRNRKQSFVAAECIRLGMPLFAQQYAAVEEETPAPHRRARAAKARVRSKVAERTSRRARQ